MAAIDFPEDTICLSPEFTERRKISYYPEQNKQNSDRRGKTTRQLRVFEGLFLAQRTKAQVAAFVDVFHDVTCNMGTEIFNVPHPRTGDTIECMFLAPPRVIKTGRKFRIEFGLEEV